MGKPQIITESSDGAESCFAYGIASNTLEAAQKNHLERSKLKPVYTTSIYDRSSLTCYSFEAMAMAEIEQNLSRKKLKTSIKGFGKNPRVLADELIEAFGMQSYPPDDAPDADPLRNQLLIYHRVTVGLVKSFISIMKEEDGVDMGFESGLKGFLESSILRDRGAHDD